MGSEKEWQILGHTPDNSTNWNVIEEVNRNSCCSSVSSIIFK
jgi:hypothetical protein